MKNIKVDELTIEGVIYVPKTSIPQIAESKNGLKYVLIRTHSAGVHCGYLKSRKDKEVVLLESIRIWEWSGANSLSQLAMEGTKNPSKCRFGMPITTNFILTEAIEIIEMTEMAKQSIQNTPAWKI